jgi:hypothetical protein
VSSIVTIRPISVREIGAVTDVGADILEQLDPSELQTLIACDAVAVNSPEVTVTVISFVAVETLFTTPAAFDLICLMFFPTLRDTGKEFEKRSLAVVHASGIPPPVFA